MHYRNDSSPLILISGKTILRTLHLLVGYEMWNKLAVWKRTVDGLASWVEVLSGNSASILWVATSEWLREESWWSTIPRDVKESRWGWISRLGMPLSYEILANYFFLGIWEAADNSEFILSGNGFGLWEGRIPRCFFALVGHQVDKLNIGRYPKWLVGEYYLWGSDNWGDTLVGGEQVWMDLLYPWVKIVI